MSDGTKLFPICNFYCPHFVATLSVFLIFLTVALYGHSVCSELCAVEFLAKVSLFTSSYSQSA